MATSDVLQFHYCIENEVARHATKNFAAILGNAFEQYKKLWIEYIKLQKYCENAGVKIPFQVLESKSDNSNIALLKAAESCIDLSNKQTSQTSYKNSMTYNLDNVLGSNETILADDKFGQKQIVNNKLLHSPVLIKRHKSKKNSITPGRSILDDTNEINSSIPLRENITILANSSDEDLSTFVETKENQCSSILNNNDEIECTPLSKLPKKLKLSTLYNVETTLLKNGKKLKQSRLDFDPSESKKTVDQDIHKKLTKLIQPEFPTSTKNLQQNLKDSGSSETVDEEIIEDSPTKCKKSKLKMQSMKLKKSSSAKLRDNISRKINLFSDTKSANLSQCLPVHKSTQNEELYSIRKLKSFNISKNKSVGDNYEILPFLSLVDTECIANNLPKKETEKIYVERIVNNIPGEETKKIDTERMVNNKSKEKTEKIDVSNESQTQKRKILKLFEEISNSNLSCNDETFYFLGEELKEKSISNVDNTKISNENMTKNASHDSSPMKENLMKSFDVAPKKEDVFIGKTRNKAERAKMAGTSCWECEKYYGDLGLSTPEIKARQKHCSRHRINKEKPSTPEGFWYPLFSDTYESSIQHN